MEEFPISTLSVLLQAGTIWITSVLLALFFVRLPAVWSITVPTLKTLLFMGYFLFLYDGTWSFQDDYQYLGHAKTAFAYGYDPITLLSSGGFEFLTGITSGKHILYPYWTILSCWIFDLSYSSPVAMNIILTFVGAGLIKRLALEYIADIRYANGLAVFWLIHPELLSWSTVSNCKDVMVVVLFLQLAWGLVIFSAKDGRRMKGILIASTAVLALLFLRYYLPVIVLSSFALAKMGFYISLKKIVLAVLAVGIALFLAPSGVLLHLLQELRPSGMGFRLFHFVLQPLPWNIEAGYSFLTLSAIFHWVALPFAVIGLYGMRRSPVVKFLLVFGAFIILMAAAVPILETIRHRLQINILYVWGAWHFVWIRAVFLRTKPTVFAAPGVNCA